MTEKSDLLNSIAKTISDYRDGELATPTTDHVDRWVSQFECDVQMPILREMNHVVQASYFTKAEVQTFLSGLVRNPKLVGANAEDFWKGLSFLDIQGGGGSQHDMLAAFDEILRHELGFGISKGGAGSKDFVYLDDAIFTGGRVKSDLVRWIGTDAPDKANLHVLVIATHHGFYYNKDVIVKAAKDAGKNIEIGWWQLATFENRRYYRNDSDVLWPVEIPDDAVTKAYVDKMNYPPSLRSGGNVGPLKIFSCDSGRQLLEREFLKAGARIREMCQNLPAAERPLGHSSLETIGFGSTIVTYRNCPNNAPLVFWVGDPWFPLFPRKTNADSRIERLFRNVGF
ncbi:MAG: hypothetical protein EOS17_04225 [Mesorhizobium sp.]|nr:MAG: hypothetical protein EOS17_04225 [Mesorhizobium sp.]